MPRRDFIKRLALFGLGLILAGLGVAVSTRAGLGTTPISSLPYVLTFLMPFSFGTWTFIINLLFMAGQVVIQGRDFQPAQLSQLLAVAVFGAFLDVGMYLTQFYVPETYVEQILELVVGCLILACGIACEVVADVTYIPGDGFVRAFCSAYNSEFGLVKVCLDVSLVLSALAVSLAATWQVLGLREGTVIAAFAVGGLTRFLLRHMTPVKAWCHS